MSAPWGCTETSPSEKSLIDSLFQYASQAVRSKAWPFAVTPTNVGARRYSTSFQSLSRIDCHINRSYCSAPVAFFQLGCVGGPPPMHPNTKKAITTKDTQEHKGITGLCFVEVCSRMISWC